MKNTQIKTSKIDTFEEWYESVKWLFNAGMVDGTPEQQYKDYVARISGESMK